MGYAEMEAMISTWGEQLRWGASLDPVDVPQPGQVLLSGMGGSGISGDFAAVLTSVPMAVHKSYGLPAWVMATEPLLVAVSYSGNTEETLSAVAEARRLGLDIAVVTGGGELANQARDQGWPYVTVPGGLQPRAALGYLLGGVLSILRGAGVCLVDSADQVTSATLVDTLLVPGGAARSLAADLAEGLDGRIVGVYGSVGPVAPLAQRWKTQINENGKWPAWWSLMPELDHNEIVSWSSLADLTRRKVGLVCLRDRDEGDRVAARFRHTADVTAKDVAWVGEVWSQGESVLERMISLAVMGDLVSLELARVAGVDPVPVEAIEDLKKKLAEEHQ